MMPFACSCTPFFTFNLMLCIPVALTSRAMKEYAVSERERQRDQNAMLMQLLVARLAQPLSGPQSSAGLAPAELPADAATRARAMQRLRDLPANKRGAVKVLISVEEIRMLASSDEVLDDEVEAFVDAILARGRQMR